LSAEQARLQGYYRGTSLTGMPSASDALAVSGIGLYAVADMAKLDLPWCIAERPRSDGKEERLLV